MKNQLFVLSLSRLGRRWRMSSGAGVYLALTWLVSACGADNGSLFPPLVLAPGLGGASAPNVPEDPNVAALPGATEPEPTPPGEVPGVGLPLDGQLLPSPGGPRETSNTPPAPEEAEGPVVVSVSPEDGASGVRNDTPIVITFSEPMARASTEAAYQSEAIPSGSVSFEWSEGDTVLSIVPNTPPAYGSGPDPEQVEARRVSFFISASAESAAGSTLPRPYEFSYALLRQVELSVFAVQNRDLSGSFRSNDTYGAGQCARDQVNMCVGDVRVSGESEQYRGFISFELGELPEAVTELRAALNLEITGMSGNPFGNLGGLVLEHLSFEAIGTDAFGAGALEELGLIASDGGAGTLISADVSSALFDDEGAASLNQYRLRFEDETDGDNNSDAILSAWDTQRLDVTYLLP
jgi:hypothetical protein